MTTNVTATSDAIKSVVLHGVKWAVPNLGDNTETNNSAMARIFDIVMEHLAAFSVLTDCKTPQPPTIRAVKMFHNMFVRLDTLINTSTKTDAIERLEPAHVTHARRRFKVMPVRYFDVQSNYCRRWIELCLQGLGNMAQLTENKWSNDWSPATAREMKSLFREAYRLMCTELFMVPIKTAEDVFNDDAPFFLTGEEIAAYSTKHIPQVEWIRASTGGDVFTEDELRDVFTSNVIQSEGVNEDDPDTPQRERERRAQAGGQIVN